jgi:hypothetical protein
LNSIFGHTNECSRQLVHLAARRFWFIIVVVVLNEFTLARAHFVLQRQKNQGFKNLQKCGVILTEN